MISINQHNLEIQENLKSWNRKPLLRDIYEAFYKEILKFVRSGLAGWVVELGSGIGNFKTVYPQAIATDIFPNPWIDKVESAYKLSFEHNSVSNLIMFDVFHHLAYPGSALEEAKRVLIPGGRVIIFDPYISILGAIVYGVFHHEPVAYFKKINWKTPHGVDPDAEYYAAQGNATRICKEMKEEIVRDWNIIEIKRMSALSYVLSGGFSKPALYPRWALRYMKKIDTILDLFPIIFATRVLIVLEKKTEYI